jgi:hypothetical protein
MIKEYLRSAKRIYLSLTISKIVNSRQLSLSVTFFEGEEETYLEEWAIFSAGLPIGEIGLSSDDSSRRSYLLPSQTEGRCDCTSG